MKMAGISYIAQNHPLLISIIHLEGEFEFPALFSEAEAKQLLHKYFATSVNFSYPSTAV